MTLSRRRVLGLPLGLAAAPLVTPALFTPSAPAVAKPQRNDDGLYTQSWFHESFLEMHDDLAEARAAGKYLAVIWEQRGCPYCYEMHSVNMARPEISKYIQDNFLVVQINLHGSREVTDFNGTKYEEKMMAQHWRVNFTPTVVFFASEAAPTKTQTAVEAESWRLTGYWKPFHFHATFVYVASGGYKSEPNFQRWLSDYADKMREEGKEVDLW